ncbi:hypothetical protein GRI89_04990 [Altererythrobacter salegens]|uniref:Uncharacterized protein n=1 Tax=Croceibacterium salegens TaxID=1737568 RepID=A0A6I4SSP1_9SPHN|nr:hypothetical protein [Croceibacterium salegens]MXO58895.1 hypothetical protein [Croceibacterium salegens]
MAADLPPWRELSEFERGAARRFTLDCRDLSDGDCTVISAAFNRALCAGLAVMIEALDRYPTDVEISKLGVALAEHFNQVRIPRLRERGTLQ